MPLPDLPAEPTLAMNHRMVNQALWRQVRPDVTGGRLAGYWRHQLNPSAATIDVPLHRALNTPQQDALAAAVRRYGDYLGVATELAAPVLL